MDSRRTCMLLVCLVVLSTFCAMEAAAWDYRFAAGAPAVREQPPGGSAPPKTITKVKPEKPITKVKPPMPEPTEFQRFVPFAPSLGCVVPFRRPSGWEIEGHAIFARTKGKVRYLASPYFAAGQQDRIDMNTDLGLPDHWVAPSFSLSYNIRPNWAVRYSIMPLSIEGSKVATRTFTFGSMVFSYGETARTKWERLYHRVGLVYDPVRTPESRFSVFAEYARLDDKLRVIQVGCCEATLTTEANMAMAGVEVERCLLTVGSRGSSLSMSCRGGITFVDDALGADVATGLRYSVPMLNGRSGYIEGGYRYISNNKKYSEVKSLETSLDGGFVQLGFVF